MTWLLTSAEAHFSHRRAHRERPRNRCGRATTGSRGRRARPVGVGIAADIRDRRAVDRSFCAAQVPKVPVGALHRPQGHQSQSGVDGRLRHRAALSVDRRVLRRVGLTANACGKGGGRRSGRTRLRGDRQGCSCPRVQHCRTGLDRMAISHGTGRWLVRVGWPTARRLGSPGRRTRGPFDCGARDGLAGDLRSGDRFGFRTRGIGLPRANNARMAACRSRPPEQGTSKGCRLMAVSCGVIPGTGLLRPSRSAGDPRPAGNPAST